MRSSNAAGVCIVIGSEHIVRCQKSREDGPESPAWLNHMYEERDKEMRETYLNQNRGFEAQR